MFDQGLRLFQAAEDFAVEQLVPEAVSDEVWSEAARYYDEASLAALLLQVAQISVWNRLNAGIKQVAGQRWN